MAQIQKERERASDEDGEKERGRGGWLAAVQKIGKALMDSMDDHDERVLQVL